MIVQYTWLKCDRRCCVLQLDGARGRFKPNILPKTRHLLYIASRNVSGDPEKLPLNSIPDRCSNITLYRDRCLGWDVFL